MNNNKTTPKDFFLWAGAMVSLYWSVIAYINLFFDYIDKVYPDPLNPYYYVDFSSGSVRFEMASLIVLVPVFFALMYFIRQSIAADASRAEIWVRRWALYLTLFISGLTIVGTLVYVINDFLSGEIAQAFILKAVIIIGIASIGFMHFLADVRGYWKQNPKYAQHVAIGVIVLVVATILSGFVIFGTPQQTRMYRYDDQKVTSLQNIQEQIIQYWQRENKLPDQLNVLNDSTAGYSVPMDPQTNLPFEYKVTGKNTFELCADFNEQSQGSGNVAYPTGPYGNGGDSWTHGPGHVCFDRTIDPKRYPVQAPIQAK
ncbi:MAG: hypothetical protein JWO50_842 [Candidatus Kaiserbacteria bacterium]|nr:hypothetical protein [Candidatus Kaiserbacteria bacterium]